MNRKITSVALVLVMCLASIVFVAQSEDVSADERTGTIHPFTGSRNSVSKVYCSVSSQMYTGPGLGDFSNSFIYFETDPNETIEKYVKGEVSSIGDYKESDELETATEYWAVSVYQQYGGFWTWNAYNLRMETLYFPAGTYEIEFTSSNMDGTRCTLKDFTDTHYFNEFKDGRGTIKVPLTEPGSFYVYASSNGMTKASCLAWTLEYKITPAPPEQRIVECEKDIFVPTDTVWVQYRAKTTLPADTYYIESYSASDYYYFLRGSAEESSFVTNVVDKGLTDGSTYSVDHLDLVSPSYIDIYSLEESGSSYSSSRSFSLSKRTYPDPYNPTYSVSEYVSVECTREEITQQVEYKFYAGQNFSVAVDFDPCEYSYVILKSGMMYVCMDPKKLYTVKATSASEYEIYAKMADGSTASINSANIKFHTEDVVDPDDAGMAFAVVSIGFCAIAFFLLFYLGRRPKWGDLTGLPTTGVTEGIVNDVPDIPEEVPDTSDDGPPSEQ